MADVLIMGMEMPKNCIDCMFTTIDYDMCILAKNDLMLCGGRPSWCPLIPLPAGHGRLIDADAFKAMCLSATKEAKPDFIRHEDWLKSCAITTAFCRDIDEQPTIVPSEGVTDDVQKQ